MMDENDLFLFSILSNALNRSNNRKINNITPIRPGRFEITNYLRTVWFKKEENYCRLKHTFTDVGKGIIEIDLSVLKMNSPAILRISMLSTLVKKNVKHAHTGKGSNYHVFFTW